MRRHLYPRLPGLALSGLVAVAAVALAGVEHRLAGMTAFEPLVIAILLGIAVRSLFAPGEAFTAGIDFSAKFVLEVAVVLLGAAIGVEALRSAGLPLLGGIVAIVAFGLLTGFLIGRLLGLKPRLALLIACGNSICGNSAIAAVAPVIRAEGDDVAASIAFTAALGVVTVLVLPGIGRYAGLDATAYGAFAGMTVYAVPQVLAAAAPAGAVAVQAGTLVKLVRVLMLGPVVFALGLLHGGRGAGRGRWKKLLPWFILAFLALLALRALGVVPEPVARVSGTLSNWLTVVAMAALGLQVDVRSLAHAGGRVIVAAVLSLVAIGTGSLVLIALLGIA